VTLMTANSSVIHPWPAHEGWPVLVRHQVPPKSSPVRQCHADLADVSEGRQCEDAINLGPIRRCSRACETIGFAGLSGIGPGGRIWRPSCGKAAATSAVSRGRSAAGRAPEQLDRAGELGVSAVKRGIRLVRPVQPKTRGDDQMKGGDRDHDEGRDLAADAGEDSKSPKAS